MSIFVSSYLGIGLLIGKKALASVEEDIKKIEKGEKITKESEEDLVKLELINKMINGKTLISLIYIKFMLFWLPIIVHSIILSFKVNKN